MVQHSNLHAHLHLDSTKFQWLVSWVGTISIPDSRLWLSTNTF